MNITHEIKEAIKNGLLLEMAVEYSGSYSGFMEKIGRLKTLEEVAEEYCNRKPASERKTMYEKWRSIYPGNDEALAELFYVYPGKSDKMKIFRCGMNYLGNIKVFHTIANSIDAVCLSEKYQALVKIVGEENMFYPEEISGEDLLTFVCSAEEAEKYKLSYRIRTKDEYFPDEWIPIETGKYPEDEIKVQVTYIGRRSREPRCDAFAERYKGKWYWDDGEEVHIDITPITAWRYSDDAFGL